MSFQKAIQAAKSVLLAKQSYMSTYASGSLVVDHLFDSFGGLDVAIPLGSIISAKADDIDTIGIDSGDLRSNSTGCDDGLFPSRGILGKRRLAAAPGAGDADLRRAMLRERLLEPRRLRAGAEPLRHRASRSE